MTSLQLGEVGGVKLSRHQNQMFRAATLTAIGPSPRRRLSFVTRRNGWMLRISREINTSCPSWPLGGPMRRSRVQFSAQIFGEQPLLHKHTNTHKRVTLGHLRLPPHFLFFLMSLVSFFQLWLSGRDLHLGGGSSLLWVGWGGFGGGGGGCLSQEAKRGRRGVTVGVKGDKCTRLLSGIPHQTLCCGEPHYIPRLKSLPDSAPQVLPELKLTWTHTAGGGITFWEKALLSSVFACWTCIALVSFLDGRGCCLRRGGVILYYIYIYIFFFYVEKRGTEELFSL